MKTHETAKLSVFIAILLAFSLPSFALAQGTAFTYQGRLNDTSGPATGLYDINFNLYTNVSGGSAVAGPVSLIAVGASNGVFTVTLDFGTGVFNGTTYYLELAVSTNGGGKYDTLAPRQQLTPSPYAAYAAGAATASSVAATGSVPDTALSANVARRNSANSFIGNQTVTSGNVGIATISPTARLQVQGSGVVNMFAGDLTPFGVAGFETWFANPQTHIWCSEGAGNTNVFNVTPGGSAYFAGSVGIGNPSPAARLDVNGSAKVSGLLTASGGSIFSGNQNFTGGIITLDNQEDIWVKNTTGVAEGLLTGRWADNATYFTYGSGGWFIRNNVSTKMMYVTPDGNLGIGNLSPTNKLVVVNARCDGSTWINASDRNLKQDFVPVDRQEILSRVTAMPIQSWSYKTQPREKHVGPVAQDFHAAFGLGSDDKSITTVDESGVALAAIQGLNEKVESGKQNTQTQLEKLKAENAQLRERLEKLEHLIQDKIGSGE
jgi:hypothetical protein